MSRREIHDRVLNATTVDELADVYADWATSYDHDLQSEMGYKAPALTGRLLRDHLEPLGTRVLDAGCGTGLVGVVLAELGYTNIDGVDYSEDMINEAKRKGVYNTLARVDLMGSIDIPSDSVDAITCVGTFTLGHVGPSAFAELIRVTRADGYICFTVRDEAWQADNYPAAIQQLVDDGHWEKISIAVADYIEEEQSVCHLCLFRVCRSQAQLD